MSIHQKLRICILNKFPDMQFVERLDKLDNFWISLFDLFKILETKQIPQMFISSYIKNSVKYYSADNLLYFLRSSTNPHHMLDYLIPLNFNFVKNPLFEVVSLFDKYGIRGKYNYNMSECSNCLNFTVQYYYHCPIPLLIDVYSETQDEMRQSLYKMFELQRCRCIEIDTRDWLNLKDTILYNVESHLVKLHALSFMEKVVKEAEEIKDVVDELGNEIIGAVCSEDEFPFPLSECLKKFRITEGNTKYKEIMALFETEQIVIDDNDFHPLLETINENDEIDLNMDDSSEAAVGGESDIESTASNDSNGLEEQCMIITQYNGNTMYIIGQDYATYDGEYYLSHPTLIKIAIRSGVRRAEQYVDKTWRLVKYITTYGRLAYTSLLKTIDMTANERKQMFTITNTTFEQNRIAELNKAEQKIEELESHIDVNKTKKKLEQYQKTQQKICNKDNVTVTPSIEKFVVEKQPTKVKPSSIIKKTKEPIQNNELEAFLGL